MNWFKRLLRRHGVLPSLPPGMTAFEMTPADPALVRELFRELRERFDGEPEAQNIVDRALAQYERIKDKP